MYVCLPKEKISNCSILTRCVFNNNKPVSNYSSFDAVHWMDCSAKFSFATFTQNNNWECKRREQNLYYVDCKH